MRPPLLPVRLTSWLAVSVAVLSIFGLVAALHDAGHLALPVGGVFSNLFNLNKENTVPAWFSSMLLLLVAYHAYLVSQLTSEHVDRFRRYWRLFAAIFLFLSLDESAALHERVQSVLELHGGAVARSIKFVWVIPALLVCASLSVAYLRFVVALPSSIRWRLVAAGAIYIGGAAGMELVGGSIYTHFGNGLLYLLTTVLEEMLEMSGALLCLHTLTIVLQRDAPELFAPSTIGTRPVARSVTATG